MKIKQSYSRLKNLGNYENVKVGVELEKTITADTYTDLEKASNELHKLCVKLVDKQLKKGEWDARV